VIETVPEPVLHPRAPGGAETASPVSGISAGARSAGAEPFRRPATIATNPKKLIATPAGDNRWARTAPASISSPTISTTVASSLRVVEGGDGAVSVVAVVAVERDLPRVVLPCGTLNHFTADAGLH
jgi:hypothetical protein